jgi:FkbM family methyltransferase
MYWLAMNVPRYFMQIVEVIGKRMRCWLNVPGLRWAVGTGRPAYRRLLHLLYPNGIARYIHGEPVLYFSSDDARDIPENADEGSFGAMKGRVHEGAVVLDIGANVGMYTLLMARWVGPAGKVFAFEPAMQTADKLQRHVIMNQLANRVEVIRTAVGNAVGEVTFYYSAECSGNASVAASAVPGGHSQLVPVTTVDVFCQTRAIVPTFLKIDVEGFEAYVLDGALETIQQHTPDLLIETHPRLWPQLGLSREYVADRLASLTKLGYQAKNLDGAANHLESEGHLLYWHPTRPSPKSHRLTETGPSVT